MSCKLIFEIYSKIKKNYKDGGIAQVFKKGIKKIVYFLYHTNNAYWLKFDLRDKIINYPYEEDIVVNLDERKETIQYIKEYGYYHPMEIKTGLSEEHLYSNIKYKGKIIGYNKTGFSKVYIQDFKDVYQFPQNIAYTYDTYIDPEYRKRYYGTILLSEVCRYLKLKGFKSVWGHVPPWNKASIALHKKLGFKQHQLISYYWIAGISWTTSNPVKFIRRIEKFY